MTSPHEPWPSPRPTSWPGPEPTGTPEQIEAHGGGLAAAPGFLVLQAQNTPDARWSADALLRPRLVVDGVNAPVEWGVNRLPLAPGRHRVEVGVVGRAGLAASDVVVLPGQEVTLHYAAPYFAGGGGGRLGTVPQRSSGVGRGWLLGCALLVAALIALAGIAIMLGGLLYMG